MSQRLKQLTDYTASLSIQRLLQLYFVGFAIILLLITIVLVNYRMLSGFTTYLDAEKSESLDNLALKVQQEYATDPESWQKFITQPTLFDAATSEAFSRFRRRDIAIRVRPRLKQNGAEEVHSELEPINKVARNNEVNGAEESISNSDRISQSNVLPQRTSPNHARLPRYNRRLILPVSLVSADGKLIYGKHAGNKDTHFISPIKNASGEVIATLTLPKKSSFNSRQQQAYLDSFKRTLWIILALGIVLSFVMAKYLAKRFTQPIQHLNKATKALENRNFKTRIPIVRDDELGQLSHSFNQMADKLEAFEEQKKLWLGNISHDLRTPVAILRAEVEAMIDGIKQPNGDALKSLQQEIDSLSNMLDDFHQAAISDIHYQKTNIEVDIESDLPPADRHQNVMASIDSQPLNPKPLLTQLAMRSQQSIVNAGLVLSTQWHDKEVLVNLSEVTLTKIWQNLFQNSLRYTDSTPEHKGEIKIETTVKNNKLVLTWQDSAPTVPTELLASLTEPLFRVEQSRNRKFAGSGLGLSIVKDIVTSAGGEMTITQSDLGGLKVVITLPILK